MRRALDDFTTTLLPNHNFKKAKNLGSQKKERKEIWGEKGGGSFSVSFNIVLFPQSDISIQVCKPDERR